MTMGAPPRRRRRPVRLFAFALGRRLLKRQLRHVRNHRAASTIS
jgi:hypothetical protein